MILRRLLNIIILGTVLILGQSCQNFTLLPKEETATASKSNTTKKNGLVKTHRSNGKLLSEINYKNGVKHGLARSYYENGRVKNEITYKNGIKEGIAKLYYQEGGVNRETPYVNGARQGVLKKFRYNGEVSSEVTYKDGMMGNDLKEFLKSGNERSSYATLKLTAIDKIATTGEYTIKVTFSKNANRADYYLGQLEEGKYFKKELMKKLPENNGVGYYVLKPPPGMFTMQKLHFVGRLKTARGNWLIREKVFNLAIEG